MLNQLLNTMYHLNIQIKEINYKTKLIYEPGLLDKGLKEEIKKHKEDLIKLLKENEIAQKDGFIVFNHGQLYEYRYGWGAYVYVERLPNDRATSWRANYRQDQIEPYKTKNIAQNVPFEKAYEQALGFVKWLQGKRVG